MGTTGLDAAVAALRSLGALDTDWALLHGADDLTPSRFKHSDLDIVVDRPPSLLLPLLEEPLEQNGLLPVVLSRYDAGKTSFLFCCNDEASEGVQLDLLYDPYGHGVLRLPSIPLLESVEKRGPLRIPSIGEDAELIYLWRKAVWKRESTRQEELRRIAGERKEGLLRQVSRELTGSESDAKLLLSELPAPSAVRSPVNVLAQSTRLAGRLLFPKGFWLHLPGEHSRLAQGLCVRFARFLLASCAFELAPRRFHALSKYARQGFLMRRRAALVVTWGTLRYPLGDPDLVVDEFDNERAIARKLTAAMAARLKEPAAR